jgi:hypothetical protein
MTRFALSLLAAAGLGGCTASFGTVGLVSPASDTIGVKLLRPGVTGRSCRVSVAGIPTAAGAPDVKEAMAEILALDREGDVVVNAEIRWHGVLAGVYNRRCVEVRGDLARTVSTIRLPAPPGHGGHGGRP